MSTNAYARALSMNPGLHDYVVKKLRRVASYAPCGPFQIEGMEELPESVLYSWPREAKEAVRGGLMSEYPVETRVHIR